MFKDLAKPEGMEEVGPAACRTEGLWQPRIGQGASRSLGYMWGGTSPSDREQAQRCGYGCCHLWVLASVLGQATTRAASLGRSKKRGAKERLRGMVDSGALCLNLGLVLSEDLL